MEGIATSGMKEYVQAENSVPPQTKTGGMFCGEGKLSVQSRKTEQLT